MAPSLTKCLTYKACSLCSKHKWKEVSLCQESPHFREQIRLKRLILVFTLLLSTFFDLLLLSPYCPSQVSPFNPKPLPWTEDIKDEEIVSFLKKKTLQWSSLEKFLRSSIYIFSFIVLSPDFPSFLPPLLLLLIRHHLLLPRKDSICLNVSGKSLLKGAAKSLVNEGDSCLYHLWAGGDRWDTSALVLSSY